VDLGNWGGFLKIIVSRALQPQDGRTWCPVDRNLQIFYYPHWFFDRFWIMWRQFYIKSVSGKKVGSSSNAHLLYHCSFHYFACARCMTRRVNLRAQKQLVQTSLKWLTTFFPRLNSTHYHGLRNFNVSFNRGRKAWIYIFLVSIFSFRLSKWFLGVWHVWDLNWRETKLPLCKGPAATKV